MFLRNQTRPIKIKDLTLGGNNHVIIQSMCNKKTSQVDEVVNQILTLEQYGCEMIRVSILDEEDAFSIKKIKERIHIPLVADIHFDAHLALMAIEAGIDKIRINPGNIGSMENIKKVVEACKEKHIPIRIGINSGSLEKDLQEKYGVNEIAMLESAKRHIRILEDLSFYDIVLSLKSSSFELCMKAYELAAKTFSYPLHIGVTETGPFIPGVVKSTLAMSEILKKGIGSTMRISLSEDPIEEIKVAKQILACNHLLEMPTLIACPTCGRTQIDLIQYAKQIEDYLYNVHKPLKVAIMGCVVNGPGEAKEADIGIAGGHHCAVLFKKGKIIKTINENQIVEELKKEIDKM